MYNQYTLFSDVDSWQFLSVFVKFHGYVSIGDLVVAIINVVCDRVIYTLDDRHNEYVSDDISIYP